MTPRAPRFLVGAVGIVVSIAACAVQRSPEETGGVLVSGTEGLDYLGGRPFSLSPDGRWLVFSKDPMPEPPGMDQTFPEMMRRILEGYVLLDLRDGRSTRLALADDAAAFLEREISVGHGAGCWVPTDGGWLGSLGWAGEGHLGFDPTLESPLWRIFPAERDLVRASCPLDDRFVTGPRRVGRFQIAESGGDRVLIVDADQPTRVLATHRAPRILGYTTIADIQLSPDGSRMSYAVYTERFGFSRSSEGYVLDIVGGEPRLHHLGWYVPVSRWSGDGGALFGYSRGVEGAHAVYQWSLPLER